VTPSAITIDAAQDIGGGLSDVPNHGGAELTSVARALVGWSQHRESFLREALGAGGIESGFAALKVMDQTASGPP
jgi:hypothetical protein